MGPRTVHPSEASEIQPALSGAAFACWSKNHHAPSSPASHLPGTGLQPRAADQASQGAVSD